MERNTVKRAIKTEIDTRTEQEGNSVDLRQKHKQQHPRHVKVSPWVQSIGK